MEYKIALCVVEMSMHTLLKILGVWFHKTYKYSISVEAYHLILIAAGQKKITAVFVIWDSNLFHYLFIHFIKHI